MADGWLTKGEVNEHYYATVAGEIAFSTEAADGYHPGAVANLIAAQATARGKRAIRILELGANNARFAHALLNELRERAEAGVAEFDRIDYLAVELARRSLEASADWVEENGLLVRRGPASVVEAGAPPAPALVALITGEGARHETHLGLVHADANQFVRSTRESFDFVILDESLDDLPYRAYFADAEGEQFEAVSYARPEGGRWRVRVVPEPLLETMRDGAPAMLPSTVTARSAESVELVTGIGRLLAPGGVLLVHDYGFADDLQPLALYEGLQGSLPPFVELEFPPGSESGFPRNFFRLFANEKLRVVQVTNDVNFAELATALAGSGTVTTLPHGSSILNQRGELKRGDGVFLSEFGLFEPGDDVGALLADLHAEQERLRADFAQTYAGGRSNGFLDLVFVKS